MAADISPSKKARLYPVDMLRGLLILLMALDHANFHIARQHSSGEYWGGPFPAYSGALPFFTRFATHLSAPGFFFLLGAGMVLFLKSRQDRGWSRGEIRGHFLLRGLILILLQLLLNLNRIWSTGSVTMPLWYGGVLAALGAGMILGIPLLKVKPVYLAGLAAVFFVVLELLTPRPDLWGSAFENLAGVLLVYGGGQGDLWVNYPFLAWMEVILFGMVFGSWLAESPGKAYRRGGWAGAVFLAGFLTLRSINGFGNIRPYQPGSWIDFLNLVKYPPSMTFVLLTVGLNLILLWLFSRLDLSSASRWNPLMVFGRVPLFSYLTHIGIYLALGRLLTPGGSSLGVMYSLWMLGLGILYWPARWYGMMKISQTGRTWTRFL